MERRRRAASVRLAVLTAGALAIVLVSVGPAAAQRHFEGSSGPDYIRGSRNPDLIFGREGDDVLRGRAGADRLVGGPGDDLLKGGPGRDTYVCGHGFDVVVSDIDRHPDERAGDGCDAVIFEVETAGR